VNDCTGVGNDVLDLQVTTSRAGILMAAPNAR